MLSVTIVECDGWWVVLLGRDEEEGASVYAASSFEQALAGALTTLEAIYEFGTIARRP